MNAEAVDNQLITTFGDAIKPRDYQYEAVRRWSETFRGVLNMGTGTGKTLTSLLAVAECWPRFRLVVVSCPTSVLVDQWRSEIQRVFPSAPIFRPGEGRWRDASRVPNEPVFLVGTMQSLSRAWFLDWLAGRKECLLIADEMHRLGSDGASKLLKHDFQGMIGLSATPNRPWDPRGQGRLESAFRNEVFRYSLEDAIQSEYLVPYDYHIHVLSFTEEERGEYQQMSLKIRQLLLQAGFNDGQLLPQFLQQLDATNSDAAAKIKQAMIRRSHLHKEAIGKTSVMKDILEGHDFGRCLVYCNRIEHVDAFYRILQEFGCSAMKYTSRQDQESRRITLQSFERGMIPFLLAVRCLDEGVDVPECDSAIIVSSSTSTREYIQRRGRVLRRAPGKQKASIHDLLVLPVDQAEAHSLNDSDRGLVAKELRRASMFGENATNKAQVGAQVRALMDSFSIDESQLEVGAMLEALDDD